MFRILTLLENNGSPNQSLSAAFGLSFLIEKDNHTILFDTGSNKLTVSNAEKMNVDVKKINDCIISHSHFDHAGGYRSFLEAGLQAPLVTGQDFFQVKYAKNGEKYTYLGCGFSETILADYNIKHISCSDILELGKGLTVVGNFPRKYMSESIPERFQKIEGSMIPDDFSDEICLAIDSKKGLIVVVGCSHPGLLNMLDSVQTKLNKKIYGVVGGAHLKDADEHRVEITLNVLEKMGIEFMGLNHCTGEFAEEYIKKHARKMKSTIMHTGDCVFFD